MKTIAQKAGINNERLRNHSGRKTMIQTLSENDIPPQPRTQGISLGCHRREPGYEVDSPDTYRSNIRAQEFKEHTKLQQSVDDTGNANVQTSQRLYIW